MCRIPGVIYDKEYYINDYLKSFYKYSCNHPHVWGFALADGDAILTKTKSLRVGKSYYFKEQISQTVYAKTALSHNNNFSYVFR